MSHRPVTTIFTLMIALLLALPAQARQILVAPTFRACPGRREGSAFCSGGLPTAERRSETAATATASAEAKPFTQDQVQAMVRNGLRDETGAKAIEQRGIDFSPTEDFLQSLKAADASAGWRRPVSQGLRLLSPVAPKGRGPQKQ